MIKGIHYQTGQLIEISMNHEKIEMIRVLEERASDPNVPYIAPGLVDLQINGYKGFDLNTLPLAKATVVEMTRALWAEGVTSYYPTVITNSDTAIEQTVRVIAEACAADARVNANISGIHLEGPFLSMEDGPRGAHDKSFIKAPDWRLFERWQDAALGMIKIITLSPEWPGAVEFIRNCVEIGVTVSIGHTAATPEQIHDAVQAGARLSTHLGNGAHLMLPRHPNYIWEQLAQDSLYTCCIADGFHLPDSVLKVILKVKGEQALLVSDAVYLCGMEPGSYQTHIGGDVVLTPDGRLHLADHPKLLAGSAQMLTWGIHQLVSRGLTTLAQAWDMASVRPANAMSLEQSVDLNPGSMPDLVLFTRNDQGIHVVKTMKAGELVYG